MNWKKEMFSIDDVIVVVFIFFVVIIVLWLSNREIKKLLKCARKSEIDLKIERNNLKIKVKEKIEEFKKIQMEKMTQLYRFAEFGRLSSGLFHDLINPLTAISLNLEQVKDEIGDKVNDAKLYLGRAFKTTKKMEDFVIAVRKQIQKQETKVDFSLTEEIIQCIQIFSHKARKSNVKIIFNPLNNIWTHGDVIKFNQLVTNLISNAIDSYDEIKQVNVNRKVKINLSEKNKKVYLIVKDNGSGISDKYIKKIWDPFFTTKGFEKGTGIGLSLTKNIIETEFNGKIKIDTKVGKGTKFKVCFLLKKCYAKIRK